MNNDLISREALLNTISETILDMRFSSSRARMEHEQKVEWAMDRVGEAPAVDAAPITGETSDGYHTFNELYHHRAVLFSVIVKAFPDKAWKARKHHDGSMYDGMFIVGIETPDGQATYHYDIDPYWDMFDCREVGLAPEWDGHTAAQAIERIGKLEPVVHGRWEDKGYITTAYGSIETGCCPVCGAVDVPIEPYDYYCPNCSAKMDLEET